MNQTSRSDPAMRSNVVAAPRPQTQVECYLGEISNDIDLLEKTLAAHEDRISPVLRLHQAEKGANTEPPEEMLVPTADRLRNYHKRIQQLIARLQYITERTEA